MQLPSLLWGVHCELRHMSELPEILRRVDFDMSVCSAILATQPTKEVHYGTIYCILLKL
jgi:hypothetical protein